MKNFSLIVAAISAMLLAAGCQKYDDSQIRQEIKDLGERVAAIETWCRNSQEAIDNVAVLKEAVDKMKSVKSVDAFDEDGATGYVITFTDGQSIRLYNGKNGKDGDAFFGKVEIGTEYVVFTLADGTSFTVRRALPAAIGFISYDTKVIARGDTVWTAMDPSFTKSAFAAFTAELMTEDGTSTAIATKSAADGNPWKIEAVSPEFDKDGKLARPAGIIVTKAPQAGGKCVLKVTLINNEGREETSSRVVEVAPNYLTFQAVEAGATACFDIAGNVEEPSLEYSTDLENWTSFDFSNPQTITLENIGDKVYWRNKGKAESFSLDNENFIHIWLTKKIIASGSIMSLLDRDCLSMEIPCDYCFSNLFNSDTELLSAPELPATTLKEGCYLRMFKFCYGLTCPPELPCMEVEDFCYYEMFNDCTSLSTAPELPAKDLAYCCYQSMFKGCTSLATAPALPAEKVADGAYCGMFSTCMSLENAPELPALSIGEESYVLMFQNCRSLRQAPELPATDLARFCYYGMFSGCYSLEKAPNLPAERLAEACYYEMFLDCYSLVNAPEISAEKLSENCCYGMFSNCSSLKNAPELPVVDLTDAAKCYAMMFSGCKSLVKAPELPATKLSVACYFGMFNECSSLEVVPEVLPATDVPLESYYGMFINCSSLVSAPSLPANKLSQNCYLGMFEGCSSLIQAPALPATDLTDAPGCYGMMFNYCSSLESAPELPATELSEKCYYGMFNGCSSLKKIPELPATELSPYCYSWMFSNCSSLDNAPELPARQLVQGCYEMLFAYSSRINHIVVGFEDWNGGSFTEGWVAGVSAEGTFECPDGLEIKSGDSYIPEGWNVVSGGSTIVPEANACKASPNHNTSLKTFLKAPELVKCGLRKPE